jgi:signal transduction histidine kinase
VQAESSDAGVPNVGVGRYLPDEERDQIADEQAALRRVATLVARGAAPEEVFTAVADEVGQLLPVDIASLCRYESDAALTFLSQWGSVAPQFPVGSQWMLGGRNVGTLVFQTSRPARIDYKDESSSGQLGVGIRAAGFVSAIGTPIVVERSLWGVIAVASQRAQPLPVESEARLVSFTELVAMAIANSESRSVLARLAEEQAALSRLATLVARGVPEEELFGGVTDEVGRLFPVEFAIMGRYESDGTLIVLAVSGSPELDLPLGSRASLGGKNVSTLVHETRQPARIDDIVASATGSIGDNGRRRGVHSTVGTPIIVERDLWGIVIVGSTEERPLAADTEARLGSFTELLATAIANAYSRGALAQMAEEQAALRRVATLVARGEPPEAVFAVVAKEIGRLLAVEFAILVRYDPQDTLEVVGTWTRTGAPAPTPVGGQLPLGGHNVTTAVYRTGRSARIDYDREVSGVIGQVASRDWGLRSSVGVPVSAESRLWGCIVVAFTDEERLPTDTEARLASFTELVTTAIANAESRTELMASRARIVAAADESRRRIERDLHDGTQQQLVSVALDLRRAQSAVPPNLSDLNGELSRIAERVTGVYDQVREISRGIHPAILSEHGLQAALKALVRRSAVPVELDLRTERRLPEQVEVAAYYAISEALANAVKHAHASVVYVVLGTTDLGVRLEVRDDGIGGADPMKGSGLTGIRDRVEALAGTLKVTSPASAGTTLTIEIPV